MYLRSRDADGPAPIPTGNTGSGSRTHRGAIGALGSSNGWAWLNGAFVAHVSHARFQSRGPPAPAPRTPGTAPARRRPHERDAACSRGTYRRKPPLPQDLELLRHGRLSDTELPRDDLDDLPGRM